MKTIFKMILVLAAVTVGISSTIASANEAKKGKEKHLFNEKTVKFKKGDKSSTKIDFDAADISGERKTPFLTTITKNQSDNGYDFIWIRKKWHPEMVQSASSLDSGY